MDETAESVNNLSVWVPVISVLLGVIAGGLVNIAVRFYEHCREVRSLRMSLLSEVHSLLAIIEERDYINGMIRMRNKILGRNIVPNTEKFSVKMPDNYAPVFSANVGKIGLLGTDEAFYVSYFHQLLLSVVQDITSGGKLYNGGTDTDFKEAISLLSQARDIGNELILNAKLPKRLKT